MHMGIACVDIINFEHDLNANAPSALKFVLGEVAVTDGKLYNGTESENDRATAQASVGNFVSLYLKAQDVTVKGDGRLHIAYEQFEAEAHWLWVHD